MSKVNIRFMYKIFIKFLIINKKMIPTPVDKGTKDMNKQFIENPKSKRVFNKVLKCNGQWRNEKCNSKLSYHLPVWQNV